MTLYKKYFYFLILNDMDILSKRIVNKCFHKYSISCLSFSMIYLFYGNKKSTRTEVFSIFLALKASILRAFHAKFVIQIQNRSWALEHLIYQVHTLCLCLTLIQLQIEYQHIFRLFKTHYCQQRMVKLTELLSLFGPLPLL